HRPRTAERSLTPRSPGGSSLRLPKHNPLALRPPRRATPRGERGASQFWIEELALTLIEGRDVARSSAVDVAPIATRQGQFQFQFARSISAIEEVNDAGGVATRGVCLGRRSEEP